MSELRKNILDESRRIVVKIGSRILVDSEKGGVRTRYIQKLADSVARLMEAGKEVVIVTSGAVGTYRRYLESRCCPEPRGALP